MIIEAMKQMIELYDKRCYNNDYGGIEFNKRYGYKFNEAIEALRTAIQHAEAQQAATGEPVVDVRCEGCGYMTHHREHMGCVRAAKQHTHPAPSVPADVVRDAERYRWLRNEVVDWYVGPSCATYNDVVCEGEYKDLSAGGVALDSAIDAAMLAAK